MIEYKKFNEIFTEELNNQFKNDQEYSNLKNSYEMGLIELSIAKDLNAIESTQHFEKRLKEIENKIQTQFCNVKTTNKINFLASTLYNKDFVLKVAMSNNRSLTTTIKTLSKLYKDCLQSDRLRIENDIQNFVNSVVRA